MLGRGLGQSSSSSTVNIPWWCGSTFVTALPASWTPSCFPSPPAPHAPIYSGASTDAAIAAGVAATQQQNQDFYSQLYAQSPTSLSSLFGGGDGSDPTKSWNPLIWLVVGVGVILLLRR
jgi:hypothetical protein